MNSAFFPPFPKPLSWIFNSVSQQLGFGELEFTAEQLQEFDFEHLRSHLEWHRLAPHFISALQQAQISLKQEQAQRLRQHVFERTCRNLDITRWTQKISARLKLEGIPHAALKGPSLSFLLFQSLSLRPSTDIDLLVRPKDIAKTIQILRTELGFAGIPFNVSEEKMDTLIRNGIEFNLLGNGLTVDLHWSLSPIFGLYTDSIDEILSRSQEITINKAELPILGNQDLVCFLCYHAWRHGWARFFWIADIAALLQNHRNLNWQEIFHFAEERKLLRCVLLSLLLAKDYFQAPLPEGTLALVEADSGLPKLLKKVKNMHQAGAKLSKKGGYDPSKLEKVLWSMRLAADPLFKLRTFLQIIFLPSMHDLSDHNMPNFLYLIYRPSRLFLEQCKLILGIKKKGPRVVKRRDV